MNVTHPQDDDEFRRALAVLIDDPDIGVGERRHRIDLLCNYLARRGLTREHCLLAEQHGRILASCLCVDAPGRTASLVLPGRSPEEEANSTLVRLLQETTRRAGERGIQMLQVVQPCDAVLDRTIYARAGFEYLAELLYLEADLTHFLLPHSPAPAMEFLAYSDETHQTFAKTLVSTYADSLDCGTINGRRDIEDILASHRATGEFWPRQWLVGLADGRPAGAILLAHMPEKSSHEVVYLGITPAFRKQGYGSALLGKGIQLARNDGASSLTLAVDARNVPARNLYKKFSFRQSTRRDVWICFADNAV